MLSTDKANSSTTSVSSTFLFSLDSSVISTTSSVGSVSTTLSTSFSTTSVSTTDSITSLTLPTSFSFNLLLNISIELFMSVTVYFSILAPFIAGSTESDKTVIPLYEKSSISNIFLCLLYTPDFTDISIETPLPCSINFQAPFEYDFQINPVITG